MLWKGKEGAVMKGGGRDMVAVFITVVRKAGKAGKMIL